MLRLSFGFAFALLAFFSAAKPRAAEPLSPEVADAVAWHDTLGYPDATKLPYARVATGLWSQSLDRGFENWFVEGFLLREEPEAFTVFVCSVSDFASPFEHAPFTPLSVQRLVKKRDGPEHLRVGYAALDLKKVAAETLERARRKAGDGEGGLTLGSPVPHRVRLFAFGRACLQQGLSDDGSALMELAANIPDEKREQVGPRSLKEILQDQIGELELNRAEEKWGNLAVSVEEILPTYDGFEAKFPANLRVAYAREAAELARTMIAEEKAHQPKPLDQMTPAEQAAEHIYQLRDLHTVFWVMHGRYPAMTLRGKEEPPTPIHRLVDLDKEAIPLLITALDDRRFTRCMHRSMKGWSAPRVLRVSDIAQRILEHMSGKSFYPRRTNDGKVVIETSRQRAEAWWAEMNAKGEQQQLVEAASAGDQAGANAARRLVEKYPDAALPAIEAGFQAAVHDGTRAEFVEIAARLPGDVPLAFLRSKLGPRTGVYPRVQAAEALLARGQPGTVPAMIDAWQRIQPRLPRNRGDAYGEAGRIIGFLVKSGDAGAIQALGRNLRAAPLDARLAVAQAFLPKRGSLSANGATIHVDVEMREFPAGQAAEIERLLRSQLSDKERRLEMKGNYGETVFENPRVCDVAALALARRWPGKYTFEWSADAAECDAQISKM